MIFLSALLDVCELNHAKDIENQLNEQFLKDTDVEAHIKLITRKSMSGSMVTRYSLVFTKPEEDDKREGKKYCSCRKKN